MAVSTATAPTARWSQLRLRRSTHLRDLCAETSFTLAHLVQPIFVVEGLAGSEPIPGLDGNARLEPRCRARCDRRRRRRGRASLPAVRRAVATPASSVTAPSPRPWSPRSSAHSATRCTCGSTSACARAPTMGTARSREPKASIDLDATLEALAQMTAARRPMPARTASSPSDMMDGRTARLRAALDGGGHGARADHELQHEVREPVLRPVPDRRRLGAAVSATARALPDRRAIADATRLRSSVRCANEGADLLMVKPGMTSLDLIGPIREATGRLVGAYQVSGEYAGLVRARPRRASPTSTRRCSRPGTCSAAPAPPTSSPTAPAARGRWESPA